ncbi:DUF3291 domain-containing protein [Cocleimonas sp. KMM 6892]|uniref:DUF3291 domain-containing protein n=1 Tax=unclassified Cocleimonas TaxID=2639732 RepID=UPI002DBA15A2|nr:MULTISPECIES: DUF3291 domain-containing protein [unclassified Cocleimonas]MEB8433587.1 DUF3291 domain-containing protein [Cocleimonas sp. KMM 6892]MEC4716398.1 DUF3291 domain-containing protein [Cocleimonas sp. KMM 6895]MEC4745709.1 DUF3291 domain-containing protein [Cocleimonas sp. KMM 6896]
MENKDISYHIAQINIAQAKADKDSEIMSGFISRLDEIHTLADNAPGFIWRLETEDGDDGSVSVFNDPLLLINMSVWRDIDSLRAFVYKSIHIELLQDRDAWFDKMGEMHQTLWWVPAGHIPTIQEGKDKLDQIREFGPTAKAFTFGKKFPSPT